MSEPRDGRGRFAKGNAGGPGRPRRQTEREYLRAVLGACSIEDWEEVVRRAVVDAKAGDARAREWLSAYVLGGGISPSTLAVEEEAGVDPLEEQISLAKLLNP
jgi:hypothetical protein